MMDKILNISDPDAINRTANVIRQGGLVILPTDTVYGIAAETWNAAAVEALYNAKQRPIDKAIPVLLADDFDAKQVATGINSTARALMTALWPGPLTIALPKQDDLPEVVSSLDTVGVRIPDHEGARALIRACGGTLAVTSANISERPAVQRVDELDPQLLGSVDLVLDGGECPGGVPSTVISIENDKIIILRPGPVDEAALNLAEHHF